MGKADEPHLPFQGTESMFTTTGEAIDWHIRAVLLKVSRHSFTAGEGVEARDLIQVQGSQVWGEDGHEIPAGPRGAASRCSRDNSYQHANVYTVILCS